jgi:septum formation protein
MYVILASNSPRRRELLTLLGLDFIIVPANVDEITIPGESAFEYVARLASAKAIWVRDHSDSNAVIIAADTTVADGDQILGKPSNDKEAEQMLRQLRGRVHKVYSSVVLSRNDDVITQVCVTEVPLRCYSDDEIQRYIKTRDPMDKAGAYAIQNAEFHPVESLHGCYANVMGLPLCHLSRALSRVDVIHNSDIAERCQDKISYECPVFSEILSTPITGKEQP